MNTFTALPQRVCDIPFHLFFTSYFELNTDVKAFSALKTFSSFILIMNAMFKSSVISSVHQNFTLVLSCSHLQRLIWRHKLSVTDSTMWQGGKSAKIKSKSAVSVEAVLGFVVLYNRPGKQLLLIHQRLSHTRVKNLWAQTCADQ